MKTRLSHIVISSLLLCNLFFTQLLVNFFHCHHTTLATEKHIDGCDFELEGFHEAVDKCKVCSLDICHELFDQDIFLLEGSFSFTSLSFSFSFLFIESPYFFRSGRAPPLVALLY